jgi:hypothetical protein
VCTVDACGWLRDAMAMEMAMAMAIRCDAALDRLDHRPRDRADDWTERDQR